MGRLRFLAMLIFPWVGFSQSWGIGGSFTLASGQFNKSEIFSAGSSVGSGILLLKAIQFGENSRHGMLTGLELASQRHNFITNGFSLWRLNVNLRLPLLYALSINPKATWQPIFRTGVIFHYQSGLEQGTLMNNQEISFQRNTESGFFYFFSASAGVRYKTKKNHCFDFTIGLNNRPKITETITYSRFVDRAEYSWSNSGYFIDFKIVWFPASGT